MSFDRLGQLIGANNSSQEDSLEEELAKYKKSQPEDPGIINKLKEIQSAASLSDVEKQQALEELQEPELINGMPPAFGTFKTPSIMALRTAAAAAPDSSIKVQTPEVLDPRTGAVAVQGGEMTVDPLAMGSMKVVGKIPTAIKGLSSAGKAVPLAESMSKFNRTQALLNPAEARAASKLPVWEQKSMSEVQKNIEQKLAESAARREANKAALKELPKSSTSVVGKPLEELYNAFDDASKRAIEAGKNPASDFEVQSAKNTWLRAKRDAEALEASKAQKLSRSNE